MPTIPESPRRSTTTASAGGNPVKNDPTLIVLMERLDMVDSYEQFDKWKDDFLERFEFFLGEDGSAEASKAYEHFRQARMENVVKKVKRLSDYREKGDVSVDRVSVRARNAMNEVSVILLDTCKDVRSLVPPTSADEERAGYTKYHLGSILVRDGFQEYERLHMCRDVMDKMRDECVQEIGDEKLLEAIRKYDDEVKRFVSIMEDLGLYKIMLKEREFDPKLREKARKEKLEAIENEPPKDPVKPTIPELPFGDDVTEAQTNDVEYEEEIIEEYYDEVTVEETIFEEPEVEEAETPPKPTSPPKPETTPESEIPPKPESPKKSLSPQKRESTSRTNYDVGGSWGTLPMNFDGEVTMSPKLKMKQDLAVASGHSKPESPKQNTRADQVFVTPARTNKKTTVMPVHEISVNLDDDQSVGGLSFTSETAHILETDTPKTRKAKLEWKAVKSASKRRGSLSNKDGSGATKTKSPKGKSPKNALPKVPKPPRPSSTKELTTKTQDVGWSLPMSSDADASSVWSRSNAPTKRTDGASVVSTTSDSSIGPGIRVRRVSRTTAAKEEPKVTVEQVSTENNTTTIVPAQGTTTVVTNGTEIVNVDGGHTTTHHNDIDERHVYQTIHRTVKTTYETDHVDHHHVYNTGVVNVHYISGVDWIGTVPSITVLDSGRYYVERPGVRRSSYIRMITFCGVDDSIDPRLLGIVCQCYPLVEFAVLMRQDMAGQPRYASPDWIQRLARVQAKSDGRMNLAAHLCGSFVKEVLEGNDSIITRLKEIKFQRIQLNVSSKYGVNTHDVSSYVEKFLEVAAKHTDIEIAIQLNDESRPLWIGILGAGEVPKNVSFLFDPSMGRGEVPESWTPAPKGYKVGYAGGIGLGGRNMTRRMLEEILGVGNGQAVWVSMESSLRCTKDGKDVFNLEKAYEVMDVAHDLRIHLHPDFVE